MGDINCYLFSFLNSLGDQVISGQVKSHQAVEDINYYLSIFSNTAENHCIDGQVSIKMKVQLSFSVAV